jgi:hypothetical protein
MSGMRGEDRRPDVRRISAHCEVVLVHRIKSSVAIPASSKWIDRKFLGLHAHSVVASPSYVLLVTTAYTGFWSAPFW